jgi:hypothetical protein
MDLINRQVVGGRHPCRLPVDSVNAKLLASRRDHHVAGFEGVRPLPLRVRVVPEGVVFGRSYIVAVDLTVHKRVRVNPQAADLASSALPGLGVFGKHPVTDLDR